MDEKMGAKNIATRKPRPKTKAVTPVLPPSLMPTEDSATTVRGEVPSRDPTRMAIPSTHRVIRRRGKRALSSMNPGRRGRGRKGRWKRGEAGNCK
jgi:hypothetical protein